MVRHRRTDVINGRNWATRGSRIAPVRYVLSKTARFSEDNGSDGFQENTYGRCN